MTLSLLAILGFVGVIGFVVLLFGVERVFRAMSDEVDNRD
jgi:hypothetical protein